MSCLISVCKLWASSVAKPPSLRFLTKYVVQGADLTEKVMTIANR